MIFLDKVNQKTKNNNKKTTYTHYEYLIHKALIFIMSYVKRDERESSNITNLMTIYEHSFLV